MKQIKKIGVALFAALSVSMAFANPPSRRAMGAAVVPGYWHLNRASALRYAKANNLPLIAIWSNGGGRCSHCLRFEKGLASSNWKNWMKDANGIGSALVYSFVYSGDGSYGKVGGDEWTFCYNSTYQDTYPIIRVIWYVNGKKKLDKYYMGDDIIGTATGSAAGKKQANFFNKLLTGAGFKRPKNTPKYTGGEFAFAGTDSDGLEAEVGVTTYVDIPLSRTNKTAAAVVSTNKVVVAYPDGETITRTVYWDAGESATNVTIDIDTSLYATAGTEITLTLVDAAGKGVATNSIAMVKKENSPSNPLWIGEKTSDELDWGEWTMDIEAAMKKVSDYNTGTGNTTSGSGPHLLSAPPAVDRAYTLVLLEGALWCPDCHNTDENLLEKQEFVDWAKSNKVALVAIDLPRASGSTKLTTCSLLTRDAGNCSWAASGKSSGASYISRKMIDTASAADVIARNWEIAQKLRLPNWSNVLRPPVPSLFLIRDDGTIAARNQYFGGIKSPTNDGNLAAHLLRFDEMLAMADDDVESANDKMETTTETIGKRDSSVADRTISMIDSVDYYLLDPDTVGKRINFTLTSDANAGIALSVIEVATSGSTRSEKSLGVAYVTTGSMDVSVSIPSTNCCVAVGYVTGNGFQDAMDPYFSVTNSKSSLATYSVSTDFVIDPTEVAQTNVVADYGNGMTVALVSNQLYRITGLADNAAYLSPADTLGDDYYLALVTDDVRLNLAGETVVCQKWNPGKVGFAQASAPVPESAGMYKIRIAREDGVSGVGRATLSLDAANSSEYGDLIVLPDDPTVSWAEGDSEVKELTVYIVENEFADGDQTFCFNLETEGDVAPGRATFRLTVRENDKSAPGRIAVVETAPAMGKDMTVYARAGAAVAITLGRSGGSSGEQTVSLSVQSGTLDEETFTWDNRIVAPQTATWTMPAGAGKTKLVMTPAAGSKVDASARILTAYVLDENAPGFESDAALCEATRYVPMAEVRIALDEKATDAATVKKFAGTLAPGLAWKYDSVAKELVLSGVPSKAGSFTAVFRAYNGSTAGLTCAVTVDVLDPATSGAGESLEEPLNAFVAKSRTFSDIPVFDTATSNMTGLLTLTVPRSGRMSAKYRSVGAGSVSLASGSWDAIDAAGTLSAVLSGRSGTNEYSLAVSANADGTVDLELTDPAYPGDAFECMITTNVWSKDNPATDFKGYYTVSLPRKSTLSGTVLAAGAGYATLKMNTAAAIYKGKFAYAGILPDGKGFSGSTTVVPQDWTTFSVSNYWSRGLVPLLSVGTLDTLAGALQINPGAADPNTDYNVDENGFGTGRCYFKYLRRSVRPAAEANILWRHVEKAEEFSCEATLDAFGTYYLSTENNFRQCCETALGTSRLTFFVLDADGNGNAVWKTNANTFVNVSYVNTGTKKKPKYANKIAAASTKGVIKSLAFTLSTGIVTGKFVYDGDTYSYKGVVMPGWGSQECTECGLGGAEAALRPFISGAAWIDEQETYKDAGGRDRTIKVREGLPFSVGVQPGK